MLTKESWANPDDSWIFFESSASFVLLVDIDLFKQMVYELMLLLLKVTMISFFVANCLYNRRQRNVRSGKVNIRVNAFISRAW
jgi:hypothetical protein